MQAFWISSKWTDRALKYKADHNVLYPPFSVFTKFLKEMIVRMNDAISAYDKGSSLQFDTREKATPVCGQIITNEMKLTQDKPAKCKVSLK